MVESNEPYLEKIAKTKVAYHTILLLAINDARSALARGAEGTPEVEALLSILPPEVRSAISGRLSLLDAKYQRVYSQLTRFNPLGDEGVRIQRQIHQETWRYNLRRLSLIIQALDEHGLLREFKVEEVGRE
jgi:hypothetical protein